MPAAATPTLRPVATLAGEADCPPSESVRAGVRPPGMSNLSRFGTERMRAAAGEARRHFAGLMITAQPAISAGMASMSRRQRNSRADGADQR